MEKCSHGGDSKACSSCSAPSGQGNVAKSQAEEEKAIARTLRGIRHKILIMSGKGGVGKSSVAVALALALARRGYKVGLMDVDIHGPNVIRMLGLKEPFDLQHAQFDLPPDLYHNLKVISIEALMRNREIAVIWRGPLKHQLIRQFLSEVQWGDLDYLVIDAPPGTGDEPMSVAQTIPDAKAIIVTTPQEISLADVRKSINFCQKINLGIVGLVENMSGYFCPHCGKELPLFRKGGGEKTALTYNLPFLGSLPFDPQVVERADQGELIQLSESQSAFLQALRPIVNYLVQTLPPGPVVKREPGVLKFAIPMQDGQPAARFGEAAHFALVTVKDRTITGPEVLDTPPHEPGGIPAWLEDLGVTHVLTRSLGEKAQELLKKKGIEVVVGVPAEAPEILVEKYLDNALFAGGPQP
jgi:ATP-binding protein involved in chromosome partitioning|uniref:Iron-sulfur cluster carrier protein n=1 Tax=Desulfobacca acetoxidans TaxID=60893 RepID=A0A7C3WHR3_9BACT